MSQDKDLWLNQIEGVDTNEGIQYTGSKEAYLKFLRTFYASLDDKAKEIEESYNNGDLEYCTIKVHALKSTARIIGAGKLSVLAQKLEEAGKKGDRDIFDAHIGELLDLFRSYKAKLSGLPKETDILNKEPISESALNEAYEALKAFSAKMDVDAIETILDEMRIYKLSPKDEEIFDDIGRKLCQFDWDGIEKLLQ